MLGLLIVTASVSLVQGNLPLSTGLRSGCEDGNFEADRTLVNSNGAMKREGEDNVSVDFNGFRTSIGLYAFGLKLPMSVSLAVYQGNLTGTENLVRFSNAVSCSNTTNSLEGEFEYTPELSLSYETATAKFLFWDVHGTFVFKPKPRMQVLLLNDTFSCRMESIRMFNSGRSEYVFDYNTKSWMGWLVSKLLVTGLEQKDDTWMMEQVELWSQAMIGSYFVNAWCHPDWFSHD